MNTNLPFKPLAELGAWLTASVALNRAMRWFRPAFRDSVAQDIVADVVQVQTAARDAAYSSEQYDLEAAKDVEAARGYLELALKGGLDQSDVATVREAIRRLRHARVCVKRSAERDHAATEMLAV